jgi:alpha-tubulin suppressor-like RCC1 family protein
VWGLGAAAIVACGEAAAPAPPSPEPDGPAAASVALIPSDTTVLEGTTTRFAIEVRDSAGRVISPPPLIWSSTVPAVAPVSAEGMVVGKVLGTARIIARVGSVADTAAVTVLIRFRSVSAGGAHTCGISLTWVPYCWGNGDMGRLGNGTGIAAASPRLVSAVTHVESISAGNQFTCADAGESVFCWGSNRTGQLGVGSKPDEMAPARVAGAEQLRAVSTYWIHACALNGDGEARCWGSNWAGQLGVGHTTMTAAPAPVTGDRRFRSVSVGAGFTCGIGMDGALDCWGENRHGQLGRADAPDRCLDFDGGTTPCALQPTAAGTELRFTAVSAGASHACALTEEGFAYCWGDNRSGQLGTGGVAGSAAPVAVAGLLRFTAIAAGERHTCAVSDAGRAYCWGANATGALGAVTEESCADGPCATQPLAVETALRFAAIATARGAGGGHSCGVTDTNVAYCWGANDWGQLGGGTRGGAQLAPRRVARQF